MKQKLKTRFQSYWKLEILSILLFPTVFALWMVLTKQTFGWFCFTCFVPTAALLGIGGSYWKAKLDLLDSSEATLEPLLDTASRLKYPLLILTCAAVALALTDIFWVRLSKSTGDRIGGLVAAFLATLEYVNYYHVQLQHFDYGPDFRRLISGKGFRQSHLSRDLAERKHKHGTAR